MKRMIVLAASLTVALGTSRARPQSTPVDLRGIYVGGNNIISENPTSLAAALKVPGVDGLLLNIGWDETEPVMGQYQWTTLDQWISQAISDGKKITVSVGAAMRTPSWLFQPPPDGAGATPCTDATYLDLLQTGIYPLGLSNSLRAQYLEVLAPDAGAFPDDIQKAHVALAPDTLAIELAKQKGSGKLVAYVTSTDPNAALSIAAVQVAAGQPAIDLGAMSKTDPTATSSSWSKRDYCPSVLSRSLRRAVDPLTATLKAHQCGSDGYRQA